MNNNNPPYQDEQNKGRDVSESWMYKTFVKSAYSLLNKPLAILTVLKKSVARLQRYDNVRELAGDVREQFSTIIRMVRAYIKGDYREVSFKNIALSVAALLYFISPLDLVPDFLAIGFADDIALLAWVYANYQDEIEAFRQWEDKDKIRIDISSISDKEE